MNAEVPNRNVLIFCVNFNTENEVLRLISSVNPLSSSRIDFCIIDNSNTFSEVFMRRACSGAISIKLLKPGRNLGYFGAIRFALTTIERDHSSDFVIVANPDLVLADDFFKVFESLELPPDVGVVAPKITNFPSREQANPYMTRRPSRRAMQLRKFIHQSPSLLWHYQILALAKQYVSALVGRHSLPRNAAEEIYAAHGSLMIFSPNYLQSGGDFNHGGFLFSEEIYVAELSREKKLRTIFIPALEAFHYQHASIKKLKPPRFSEYHSESLNFIFERFFR